MSIVSDSADNCNCPFQDSETNPQLKVESIITSKTAVVAVVTANVTVIALVDHASFDSTGLVSCSHVSAR